MTNKIPIGYQTQGHCVSKRSICKSSIIKLSSKNKLLKKPLLKYCALEMKISLDYMLPSPPQCPKSTKGETTSVPSCLPASEELGTSCASLLWAMPRGSSSFPGGCLAGAETTQRRSGKPKDTGESCLDV